MEAGQSNGNGAGGKKPKRGGKFMEGIPGVKLWTAQPKLETLQHKAQRACEWRSKVSCHKLSCKLFLSCHSRDFPAANRSVWTGRT